MLCTTLILGVRIGDSAGRIDIICTPLSDVMPVHAEDDCNDN